MNMDVKSVTRALAAALWQTTIIYLLNKMMNTKENHHV